MDKLSNILNESDLKTKYSKIIDYISDYLINERKIYEICDFKNNQCIANRLHKSVNKCDGCCYNIHEGKCHFLKDKKCSINCISCKLFICRYLEKQYGKINLNKILPLKKIFNRKQREIIKRSFFKDKEEIINLLVKNAKKT